MDDQFDYMLLILTKSEKYYDREASSLGLGLTYFLHAIILQ